MLEAVGERTLPIGLHPRTRVSLGRQLGGKCRRGVKDRQKKTDHYRGCAISI